MDNYGSIPATLIMFMMVLVGLIGSIYIMAEMTGYQYSVHNISGENYNPDSVLNAPFYNNTVNMTGAISSIAVNWMVIAGILVLFTIFIGAVVMLKGMR